MGSSSGCLSCTFSDRQPVIKQKVSPRKKKRLITTTKHIVANMELDELFYTALQADEDVVAAVGDRIISTGFEVAPDEKDNTPLPCIIVSYDGFENNLTSKDSVWEGEEDSVQASIEVDAESRQEVGRIMNLVRKAIANYIHSLYDQGEEIPSLKGVAGSDIQWFWEKPCYFQTVSYVCDVPNNIYENGSN